MNIRPIDMEEYRYPLPDSRIAQYPVSKRDESKLLVADGALTESTFKHIANYLPEGSLMVFNNTRVIHSRLVFHKATGARIEVFLLEPVQPSLVVEESFQAHDAVVWKCFVGNKKKWKEGSLFLDMLVAGTPVRLSALIVESEDNAWLVRFDWDVKALSFGDLVEKAGAIPLPPYMNRPGEASDAERYQTVYARVDGSVAAPTAGLHFTPEVFSELDKRKITRDFVTLDVGAGTFQPVKSNNISEHVMHHERVHIHKKTIERLLSTDYQKVIAVGTTTTRTLESLYWFGLRLLKGNDRFDIRQWEPYRQEEVPGREALLAVLDFMNKNKLSLLDGSTQLIIAPGYRFRIVDVLVTNFHQPKSTLLLLVSAFYGPEWRQVYQYALEHDFRFLSYGDSCLLYKKQS